MFGNQRDTDFPLPTPSLTIETHMDKEKADLVARKLATALNFAIQRLVPLLESRLGRKIWIPDYIYVTNLPKWREDQWTTPYSKTIDARKALAGLQNRHILVGDVSLVEVPQDLINYWLVPHELLHTADFEDQAIDKILIGMNLELGKRDIATYIEKYSGYVGHDQPTNAPSPVPFWGPYRPLFP